MLGDTPDVLIAIIMLIALLPWWSGAIVAVIIGSVVWTRWHKRRAAQRLRHRLDQVEPVIRQAFRSKLDRVKAATETARQIADGDAPGTVTITVGENLPGSGGASAVTSAQREHP